MRVYSIQPSLMLNRQYPKTKVAEPIESPSFKGLKGAGIGAGAGLAWGGAIAGLIAIGAPYLLPIMAADVIAGGAIMGAITGHAMEEDLGSEDKDKDNNK